MNLPHPTPPVRRALALAVLLSLTACAIPTQSGSAHITSPDELGKVPALGSTAAKLPEADYWRALGDPQLDQLIDLALTQSPNLKVVDARMLHAAAIIGISRSAMQPQVGGNLKTTYQKYSESWMTPHNFADSPQTDNRWAIDASLDLDLWGKHRSAVRGAQAQFQISQIEQQAARIALTNSLARAWVELDRLTKHRSLIEQAITTRTELAQLQSIRIGAGLDADLDRSLQLQNLAAMKAQQQQITERIGLQYNLLSALAGKAPGWAEQHFSAAPKLAPQLNINLPSNIPADLLGRRPDVLASLKRVEAAGFDVEVAEKQFYPDVNLSAFIGFQSISLDQLFKSKSLAVGVAPALHLPIFQGGRLQSTLDLKSADYDAAVEQYNVTLVDALRDVHDQARTLESLQKQRTQATQALSAIERHANLTNKRVGQGMQSRISSLSAQLQVLQQKQTDLDLQARQLDSALSLARALGGGFTPEQSPFK